MLQFFARYKKFGIVMMVLSTIILILIYNALKQDRRLPIYQPNKFNPELVDDSQIRVKAHHTIAPFSLINQNGDTITQKEYQGKIYVSDFFFTTCQTICPIMTDYMAEIQNQTEDVYFLSHSVTPEQDSVPVLKAYAKRKGVDDSRWNLVTGDRKEIYDLARKSYFAVKNAPGNQVHGMIHTENFTLIDSKGRIRGWYDGTDWESMEELLQDIEVLQKEEAKN